MELMLLLFVPLFWPLVAKAIWHHKITKLEIAINIGVVSVLVTCVYFAGLFHQTADTEVWNGVLTKKERVHGSYIRTYQCMCVQHCSGSGSSQSCHSSCQTCFEHHYTVMWDAETSIGGIQFAHLDWTSRRVYDQPDPAAYVKASIGDPVATERSFTNYVKAVPDSLFHELSIAHAAEEIPAYPRVHNFYQIDRVLNVESVVPLEAQQTLDSRLDLALRSLGKEKEVNVIVFLTEIDDPNYRYAVEKAWLGGKKNDVVVFIGLDGLTITWVDVMTWARNIGNEYFHVTLRDTLLTNKTFDAIMFSEQIIKAVEEQYDRPRMRDFEYLKKEISPPTWLIGLAFVLGLGGSVGLSVLLARNAHEDFTQRYRTSSH